MPKYVLKVLIDVEARDDIDARQSVATLVQKSFALTPGIREIVLHAQDDNKSIRVNADGTFAGQWNKGGRGGGS
jgi:hypothetical protein